MPRTVRPWLGWSLMLSLSTLGVCGCSSEEPAAAPAANNQAQANAPAVVGAMPPGMPGAPGGMPGAPGGMPGAPGAMPGGPGAMPSAPGALVPPPGAVAGSPAIAPDAATAFAGAPGGAVAPGAPAVAPAVAPDAAAAFAGAPGGAVVAPGAAAAAPAAPGAAAAFAGAPGGAVVAPAAPAAAPGAAAAFAGAPGAVGVAPGAPGAPGAVGGPGGSQSPQSPPGTFGFPAEKVAFNLMRGDITGLEEFISAKCKGPLGDVRDGKATEKQIEDLKKTFTGLKEGSKPRNEGGAWSLSVRNADNAIISFKVKKEGEDYKVIEMTVKAGTAKKNR